MDCTSSTWHALCLMCSWYRPSVLVLLCLLSWAAAGCEVVLGIEERPADAPSAPTDAGDPEAADALVDQIAEHSEEAATDAGCSGNPPARPVADDPSNGGDLDLVFAVHDIDYGSNGTWKTLGFDLDGTNTVPGGAPPNCVWGGGEPGPAAFDHGCGLDNVIGAAIWEIFVPFLGDSFNTAEMTEAVQAGTRGLVLRVTGYNGQPNDTTVGLSVYKTTGVDSPTWAGADRWSLIRDGLKGESVLLSKFVDPQAYVADGVLVARLEKFPMGLKIVNTPVSWVTLDRSVFSAAIAYDTGKKFYRLDQGRLGGMLNATEFLDAIRVAAGCFDLDEYRVQACSNLDVALDDGAECNAWSMAVAFGAWEAELGDVVDGEAQLTCNDEGCGSI